MSEEATLDEFIGDDEGVLSVEPQGVRLALDESYPKEWGFAELEEVCEVNSGFTWNKEQETDSSEDGAVPVIKIGNVQDGYLDLDEILYLTGVSDEDLQENKARKDWLLMIGSNGSGERVGHCGIIEEDMEFVYASFLYGLHADSDHLLPRFLFYSLNRPKVQQRLTSFTAGSTSLKNLNKSTIENLSIPTPPLSEQRKIATVLYTVDRAIEKTGEIIDRATRVRKGLHQTLFRDWSEATDTDPLAGRYPADWELKTLSDVVSVTDAEHFTPDYVESGIPVLRPGDLNPGRISLENVEKRVDEETYEELTNRHTPSSDDIVYSRSQNFAVASQVIEDTRFCLGQDMVVIEPNEINETFLLHLLNSSVVRNQAVRRSTGSTFSRVNLGDIRSYKIPIPSDEVQQQIAKIIAEAEERIRVEKETKRQLNCLKRGLMEDLLSGTVRTTDTNIEGAEEIVQYG